MRRSDRNAAFWFACVVIGQFGGAAWAATTPAATKVTAVATYDADRNITVTWKDNSGGTAAFKLQVSTNGTTFTDVGTVAAGTTKLVDTSVKDPAKTYTYQVIATAPGSDPSTSVIGATPIVVTWPLASGSHQIMQGFTDGSPNSILKFHEGVDIYGAGTQNTLSIRGGKVVRSDPTGNGGTVVVEVDIGAGKKEYDTYFHTIELQVAVDDVIPEGFIISKKLADFGDSGKSDHLHLSVTKTPFLAANNDTLAHINAFQDQWLNPFARFTKAADRDPLEKKPALTDTNGDSKTIIITTSGNTNPAAGGFADVADKPLKSGVDIIADIRDEMNDTATVKLAASGPNTAGYYIKALFDQAGVEKHSVRSAADPYVLIKADDAYFAGKPVDNSKFSVVYADDGSDVTPPADMTKQLRVKPNGLMFPFTKQYIVTNTKGNAGTVADEDGGQFWKTNALKNAKADTSPEANGVTFTTASKNANARFKDGDYEIHITAADLVNNVDLVGGKVRVDNFKQTAFATTEGIPGLPVKGLVPLYDITNATPFLTKFSLESADTDTQFNLGDIVGTFGNEFYPELEMTAYLLDHQLNWKNGDALAGAISKVDVLSDDTGSLQVYNLWTASENGKFDIVIDYDRDGKFSSTLDGLAGLTVVPEPTAAWISLAMGVILFRRKSR